MQAQPLTLYPNQNPTINDLLYTKHDQSAEVAQISDENKSTGERSAISDIHTNRGSSIS